MDMMILLVTKPWFVCKSAFLMGLRTILIVVHTWVELVKASVDFHLNMIWRTIVCFVAVMSLPFRILNALQRETLLQQTLHEMQLEVEDLVWERDKLEDQLQAAIRDQKIMESMFAELEDEYDKAVEKIELLERELKDQMDETLQLKEICSKGQWSLPSHDSANEKKFSVADNYGIPYGIPSWKGSDIIFQDTMVQKETWGSKRKSNVELRTYLRTGFAASGSIHPFAPGITPRNLETDEILDQRRAVAISQSLFSALLSLFVGMTIWEAEEACMPLVVALFTVIGMSLRSVIHFFSTLKDKPTSEAVALLSFNWFILGTLTYPTLPKVACVLAPFVSRFIGWILN